MDHIRLSTDSLEALAATIANVDWVDSNNVSRKPAGAGHGKKRSDWLNDLLDIQITGNNPDERRAYRKRTIEQAYAGAVVVNNDVKAISEALDAIFRLEGVPHGARADVGDRKALVSLWRRTYERMTERCQKVRLHGHQEIGVLLQEVLDETSGDIPRERIEKIVAYIFPDQSDISPASGRHAAMMSFMESMAGAADENGY